MESQREEEYKKRLRELEALVLQQQEEVASANLGLDLTLEAAHAGKWEWNLETNQLKLNRTWYTRLGYEYNELPQAIETFKKVLHPEDLEKTFEAIQKYLRGETPFYGPHFRMITKNGDIQWCMSRGQIVKKKPDGTPLCLMGIVFNINPFIQFEQSLLRNQKQLEAMIRSLPASVAMIDKDRRYLAFSSRWLQNWESFGSIKVGEELSRREADFTLPWNRLIHQVLKGERIGGNEELVKISHDSSLWVLWSAEPWRDANGEIEGVIIMAENISDLKEAEIKVSQNAKLSALGEMAGGIAHEINNPMSIIKGYIDLMKRHYGRNTLNLDLTMNYLQKMDTTVDRISRIVSGMKRFSRDSSFDEKQPYSLNKIIKETLDFCQEKVINHGVALDVQYFDTDAIVFCRPIEISQVLLNLINNSFQAISSQSHPWIKISCHSVIDHFEILVVDSGKGIPDSILSKIFQPFFTTKEIGLGTGLGLSISRGIAEEHLGILRYVKDAANTTFMVELPKWSKVNN
jgi:PAS domain S-box-containing protein